MTAIALHANDLILFAHIVEAGSFTHASDQTGLPKSTLSRRLSSLENAFGERLLQRSTRRLVLTEFGERILEHARRLMEESEAAAALAQHRQATPHGTLRVSLPPEFHELFMIRVLTEFSRQYPHVRLDIDLSARRVDLIAERFDLAVRIAAQLPDDSSLVARRITTLHNGLYANPEYLACRGMPRTPEDLLDHVGLILVTSGGESSPWRLSRGTEDAWEGLPLHSLRANSVGLQQALAAQGLGIVGLTDSFAAPLVEQGILQRILPEWHLPSMIVWCVTPGRRLLPQRTIAFIESLKAVLGDGMPASSAS
ncbi:MAG: LysR family transcriptional regulator [Castellaniella sp.]|uniref:LysR family transcriptional regulator n=1 Tax=Castellaniella sp. TaxID=1955812 RepID=UPI003C792716